MCVGVPGRIVEIVDQDLQLATVDVSGVPRTISIGLLDEVSGTAEVGDWVLIHVGFALAKISEDEALATLRALQELGDAYQTEMERARVSRSDA